MPKRSLVFLILTLTISACSKPAAPAEPSPTAEAIITTLPTATATSTPTPTPTPFVPFNVVALVNNMNVRTNPGRLFSSYGMVNQGTSLLVLGKAPGGEWIYVQTPENIKGWAFAWLLETGQDLQAIPLIEPTDVQLVKGRLTDAQGTPIYGIQFALTQGSGENVPRNDAVTDANGEFYAFMPTTAGGEWIISFAGTGCRSNVWADNTCSSYKSGYTGNVEPAAMTITLPPGQPLVFTWR